MSLEELRKKIDEADTRIVRLIAERMRIAKEIGREKKKQGKPIADEGREIEVLEHIKSVAREEDINQEDIASIYRRIVTACKGGQETVVAFQGEIGAHSEEAASGFFGHSIQTKPCESLDDVFKAVDCGENRR